MNTSRPPLSATALSALLLLVAAGCADETPGPTGPVPGLAPTVLKITPDPISAGGSASLHGLNFDEVASRNRVTVSGERVNVVSASQNLLQVNQLPCLPTGVTPVTVAREGIGSTVEHPIETPDVGLAAGESETVFRGQNVRCRSFPAGDRQFTAAVFNTGRSPDATIGFAVDGRVDPTGGQGGAAAGSPGPPVDLDRAVSELPALLARNVRAQRVHRDILTRNLELAERLTLRGRTNSRARTAAEPGEPARAEPPDEGDLVRFRVPNLAGSNLCTSFTPVTARVVAVTEHAVIVEDTASPVAGQMDATHEEMAAEFERLQWDIIRTHYGNPLAWDGETDDDGHLYMLYTPQVNGSGALAFVFAGDLFTRAECASSDEAELFYAIVPEETGGFASDGRLSVEEWQWQMRATMIHEVKHIASFAERRARDATTFETAWLEEATAYLSQELYGREVFGYSKDGNVDYRQSIFCELRARQPAQFPECADKPLAMFGPYFFLASYYESVERSTPLGSTGGRDIDWLGAWWLIRWALDHHRASEASVLSALNQERVLSGVSNLEARLNRDLPDILADWTLALAVDDRAGARPERAELTVPTWNSRDVFAGLSRDLGGNGSVFEDPFPLATRRLPYRDFRAATANMPGGTAMIFELTGSPGTALSFEVTSTGGGAPPPQLGISLFRAK